MRQYDRFKRAHPGCLLFFRMGDFYELFDEDAVTAHKALGITLTERTKGVPMAGVLFPGASLGLILLPIMIFHQIQLMASAIIAQHYSERPDDQLSMDKS